MRAGYRDPALSDTTTIFPPPLLPWLAVLVMALGILSEFVPR